MKIGELELMYPYMHLGNCVQNWRLRLHSAKPRAIWVVPCLRMLPDGHTEYCLYVVFFLNTEITMIEISNFPHLKIF